MSDRAKHNHCTHKLIDLANELAAEGYDPQLISAALMSASGIYATLITAGNHGGLQPSGVVLQEQGQDARVGVIPEGGRSEVGEPFALLGGYRIADRIVVESDR